MSHSVIHTHVFPNVAECLTLKTPRHVKAVGWFAKIERCTIC